ncbi:MAG: valine--tRNA ligase [Alphaproteobacteria bacterium]|nr:MAG: valine--tRNA ligase [Alphaproteobacteria bacterium]
MLNKTFQPQEVEPRLYKEWEESGAFAPTDKPGNDAYCIVIPPPNVTGSLHMGHALNNTLQDTLVRFQRMQGKDVLWQCGTDHAGIATQMVVERQLQAENQTDRRTMGREAFVKRVWQWKEESGGTITGQLRRLGASCDWSRERFTMDEGLSKAVLKVFVQLYKEGLIYKDKRLVNWDPKLLTAISDLEVENKEVQGHMWHIRYPLAGREGEFVTVATTRPETLLGDTAVAVHPEDDRYKNLIGEKIALPLTDRLIPIVADEHADPEQGSGAVKITPAHDFNDFEVGRRHHLEMINVLDETAHLNENVPLKYQGMERFEARARIVDDLKDLGLLEKVDDHTLQVPYGDRSNVVIEPWLTEQWYVNAAELAKPAIKAVEEGETVFVPKTWEKTYYEWMRNIQPWCISRQLWWGHQIPAWYGEDGEVFVAESEEEAQEAAKAHYGRTAALTRDEDVLDTWFSSGLWPFSTLGWPDETPELKKYYKTDVLVTAFDIIFFWVARMMMFGLHFMKEVPFHTVYIHALVRDEHGQKMSKSKGNIVDPLELIDEYGADALRFTLMAMAAQGRDIQLATSRVEGYRNFGTKLWNAARFCEMNECFLSPDFDPSTARQTVNRWIISEVQKTSAAIKDGLDGYRFNDAAGAIYSFVWHIFCDWHLELIKPILNGSDQDAIQETRQTAAWVLDEILKLLHPFMPFITEELWQRIADNNLPREALLIKTSWPVARAELIDEVAAGEMDWVIRFVSEIRSIRAEMNIQAGARLPLLISGASAETLRRVDAHSDRLKQLARLESIKQASDLPEGCVQTVLDESTLAIPLAGVIDVAQETARLGKEIAKIDGEIAKIDGKLSNAKFIERAPEAVVEEQKTRRSDALQTREKLQEALDRLGHAR